MVVAPLNEFDNQFKDCVPLTPPSVSVAKVAPASFVTVNVPLLVMQASSPAVGTTPPLQLLVRDQLPLTGFSHTLVAAFTWSVASSAAAWKADTAEARLKIAVMIRGM